MRAQSWILIIIALGCGLVASIGISQVMDRGSGDADPEIEMESIFVALVNISVGDPITSQMIKLEKWPKDRVPEGAITKLEDVEKRRPRSRIFKGEPILIGKLIGTGEDEGPQPTPGYRALSVQVTHEDIIGGLIKPGDRVDIMVFLEKGNRTDIKETIIRTFLRDVKVFAVDSAYERDPEQEGKPTMAKTVTLEVKPRDVEKIVLAQQLGKIRLTLRGAKEQDSGEVEGEGKRYTSISDVTGEESPHDRRQPASPTPEPTVDQKIKEQEMLHILAEKQPTAAPQVVGFRLLEPNGVRTFEWRSGSDLPIETTINGSNGAPVAIEPQLPSPTFETDLEPPTPPAEASSDVDSLLDEGPSETVSE